MQARGTILCIIRQISTFRLASLLQQNENKKELRNVRRRWECRVVICVWKPENMKNIQVPPAVIIGGYIITSALLLVVMTCCKVVTCNEQMSDSITSVLLYYFLFTCSMTHDIIIKLWLSEGSAWDESILRAALCRYLIRCTCTLHHWFELLLAVVK